MNDESWSSRKVVIVGAGAVGQQPELERRLGRREEGCSIDSHVGSNYLGISRARVLDDFDCHVYLTTWRSRSAPDMIDSRHSVDIVRVI